MDRTKYKDYDVEDFLQDELFVKWVNQGEAVLDDFWNKWLAAHPDQAKTVQRAADIINAIHYDQTQSLDEASYLQMYENILKHSQKGKSTFRVPLPKIWRMAAVFALVGIAGIIFYSTRVPVSEVATAPTLIKKSTVNGQKTSLILADGSKIMLNAGSTLEYPESMDDKVRKVILTGEGFFEVAHDPARPFVVETSALSTSVLGTSFGVRAYDNENDHSVALLSGKVRVYVSEDVMKGESARVLSPGEQVILDRTGGQWAKTNFSHALVLGWTDGLLVFDGTRFEDVLSKLVRWYGVEIEVVGDMDTDAKFSGVFENESLENVLEVLAFSAGFDFVIDRRQVTIETQ